MNDEYHYYNHLMDGIRRSSGLQPTVGPSYIRKTPTNETILDNIPTVEIERYLRKKKFKKYKNEREENPIN